MRNILMVIIDLSPYSYKVPKLVEFWNELPKSQVGKFLRRILVEEEKQKKDS